MNGYFPNLDIDDKKEKSLCGGLPRARSVRVRRPCPIAIAIIAFRYFVSFWERDSQRSAPADGPPPRLAPAQVPVSLRDFCFRSACFLLARCYRCDSVGICDPGTWDHCRRTIRVCMHMRIIPPNICPACSYIYPLLSPGSLPASYLSLQSSRRLINYTQEAPSLLTGTRFH